MKTNLFFSNFFLSTYRFCFLFFREALFCVAIQTKITVIIIAQAFISAKYKVSFKLFNYTLFIHFLMCSGTLIVITVI